MLRLITITLITASTISLAADNLKPLDEHPHNISSPITQLEQWLAKPDSNIAELQNQPFAAQPVTAKQAKKAANIIWKSLTATLKTQRKDEWNNKKITIGDKSMPFGYTLFGKTPKDGRSLYISMHGGGGAPARVNDSQWNNQKKLYKTPDGSIYLAPRAPTDAWNLWHQAHIDNFFDRLIQDAALFADVNPNKVYLMGYSAGGDGVYQLAPRIPDRFAAASMMAGHPNETSPLGLRNLPFMVWCGEKDAAYKRNEIAKQFGEKLDQLQKDDPEGYIHQTTIVKGAGHWMNLKDAAAVKWMAKYQRNPFPKKIVWHQDDVTHDSFYWVSVPVGTAKTDDEVYIEVTGQTINIDEKTTPSTLIVNLSDKLLDLDKPVKVTWYAKEVYKVTPKRTIAAIADSLNKDPDKTTTTTATITVTKPIVSKTVK
ncbi:MAG: hypothetical protein KAS23_16760 [Anaerohalosphaera sp.]|nr:hypothetical protein [Anaerohalosphaera sp.]